ncbi:MAG TPA: hypothetical protein VGF98_14015 [Candidatus Tumulicola sp.]|jgi:hypothetical protein
MKIVSRFAIFLCSCAIAGCANATTVAGSGAVPSVHAATPAQRSWMAPNAASGNLLYISDEGYGAVFVYAYARNAIKFVGVLNQPTPPGPMCVDKQQNVWILGERDGASYSATEYAHGGTAPIAVLTDPAGVPTGCAADPTTDKLAISSTPPVTGGTATIAIYNRGRGNPKLYEDSTIKGFYDCCTYDHRGNLYGYGTENMSGKNIISELPKGSGTFSHVTLDHEIPFLYGMQWVGKYLTVADTGATSAAIDEYTISPSGAKLARTIKLAGVTLLWQYFIDGDRIIAPDAPFTGSGFVGRYRYPAGGDAIKTNEFSQPVAVVVSRGPR